MNVDPCQEQTCRLVEAHVNTDGHTSASRGVYYHFYWSKGGESPHRQKSDLIAPGTLARVNSRLPHHTWAADQSGAEAWMLFRPLSESAAAANMGSEFA